MAVIIGLKRLDTGALVKDYEGADKEVEQAVQLGLQEVVSEDPRFLEKDAPPLEEEFPVGSKIIFMGEHAYGVAAQVQETALTTLSVVLAVGIWESMPSFVETDMQC
jgi:5'-3' exonuclease